MSVLRAVVTGASSGIGAATVRALRAAGWEVVGVARREDRLRELEAETGASVFVADLTKQADVDRLRDHLAATGGVHALVNNAGGAKGLDTVEASEIDDWAWMFEVNVLALKRVTSALLPAAAARRRRAGSRRHRQHHVDRRPHGVRRRRRLQRGEVRRACAHRGAAARARTANRCASSRSRPAWCSTDEFALVRFGGDRARADAVYDGVPDPLVAEDIAGVVVDAVLKPRHVDLDLIVVKPVAQAAPYRVAKGDLVVRPETTR